MQRHPWIVAAGLAATLISASAFARTDVSVNIGVPGPVYVAPPVYAPAPVYVAPAPMMVAPPPPPRYWRGPPPGHWKHDRHWDHRHYDDRRDWRHR